MIGETVSHYRIASKLGAGGMGVVYEAEDTRLGRRVAIKLLPHESGTSEEAIQRFLREARVISSLTHPHICTLYDIGEHDGHRFMVMELMDGESLRARIDRGPLPLEDVLQLGEQMADALDAAHSEGVIHRDIKPANLFLTKRGSLKVLDFGIAKLNRANSGGDTTLGNADHLTMVGSTVGTISYMSPEQARGQEIDGRSDLFSAGIVLYEMATGHLPFPGATPATIFEGILTKAPIPPSQVAAGVPAAFDQLIVRMLEKDRETRFQSAADLRAELKRLRRATESGAVAVAPAPVATAATPASTASPASARRSSWLKPALLSLPVVSLIVVGGVFLNRSVDTPALAAKDLVVLSPVGNRTGDAMFDDTLSEALGVQLRQSPFLTVVTDQQVQSTLRLMGRDPMTPVTGEVGRELCQRAGAKALLGGSIATLGSSYVLSLNAHECVSGKVLAEQQVQSDSKENVLKTLGAAVSSLREELGESLASVQRYDAKIEMATTGSLEALKAYSQGIQTRRRSGDFDSVPFFRRAIELDSEFALAYARLGTVYSNLARMQEARQMTGKAFELRSRASETERGYIEARYYNIVENNLEKAAESYRVLLATYPDDYSSLVNLGSLERQLGNEADAIRRFEHATRVGADQPLVWQNLSSTYFDSGRFEDSRKAAEIGLKIQDSTSLRSGLYLLGTLTGDRALADAQVAAVKGRRDEANFIGGQIQVALYHGRMKDVHALSTEWDGRMEQAGCTTGIPEGQFNIAINEALFGVTDAARARAKAVRDRGPVPPGALDEEMVLCALLQDGARSRAIFNDVVQESKKTIADPARQLTVVRQLQALRSLAEGKSAEAVPLLEPVIFDQQSLQRVAMWSIAHFRQQHWLEASKGFEWIVGRGLRGGIGATNPFAQASLARARAALGQTDEARRNYENMLTLMKDADPNLPLVERAKDELAKLKN